jgi:hypothetical protein
MSIDEARQYSFAMQIYEFGVSATNAAYLVIVANRQDAPTGAVDSHSLRSWLGGIHGVNCAVQIKYRRHPYYSSMRKSL